jgi:hypothetical protein
MKKGRILDTDDITDAINNAIDAFLCKKGHAANADNAIDNLIDQYGTPELAKQRETVTIFQKEIDLIIKNKDIILANISKS